MSITIYNSLRSVLASKAEIIFSKNNNTSTRTVPPDPIILLNKFPVILNPDEYANPRSTSNPDGDLISLWRFRQLVDPIPQFASYYIPGADSTETNYLQIIAGALVEDNNSFAAEVISNARKAIQYQTFSNMDGNPGEWRPIYAVPDDWFDLKRVENFNELTLDLTNTINNKNKVNDDQLEWKIINSDKSISIIPLDSGSKINSVRINYCMVSLTRPWFNNMVFQTAGWYLKGQKAGFCSSGVNDGNGILPLIPGAVIVGTNPEIEAVWNGKDLQLINNARTQKQQLSLGPFLVNAGQDNAQLHVIGWVMSQTPFSPQTGI